MKKKFNSDFIVKYLAIVCIAVVLRSFFGPMAYTDIIVILLTTLVCEIVISLCRKGDKRNDD